MGIEFLLGLGWDVRGWGRERGERDGDGNG
jgi:hypothetical protein